MIAFFDNRKPGTVAVFVIFFIAIKALLFVSAGILNNTIPYVPSAPYHFLISNYQISFVVGVAIVLIICTTFNWNLNNSNFYASKKNYATGVLLALMTSLMLSLNYFGNYSSVLVVTSIIYMLLINSTQVNRPSDTFFYIGLFSGILVLFNHELIVFAIFVLIASNTVAAVSGKDLVKWLGGLISPMIWFFGTLFLQNPQELPFHHFEFKFSILHFSSVLKTNIAVLAMLAYSLFFLFYTMERMSKLIFIHRKLMMMNVVLLMGSYITIIFNGAFDGVDFILLLFPSVILGGFNVLTISKKWKIDTIHFIFVALVIIVNLVIP